jgi:hypothetical protein
MTDQTCIEQSHDKKHMRTILENGTLCVTHAERDTTKSPATSVQGAAWQGNYMKLHAIQITDKKGK